MPMLEVENIHSYYGNIHALKGISLTVEKGEIVTLIGGNGAGKSTTLRTITADHEASPGPVSCWRARILRPTRPTRSCPGAWPWCPKAGASSPA